MLSTNVLPYQTAETIWTPSPHVLIRFAGKSYEELERLKFTQTTPILDEIIALRAWVNQQKAWLCDELLYAEIGKHTGKTRGQIVALKRNIFNGRPVTIAERRVLREIGNPALRYEVLRYYRQLMRLEQLMQQGRSVFAQELVAKRRLLQESFRDPNFQKGVQLATPSLFAGLQNYLDSDPANISNREQRVEAGALRYFTRMAAKTSPFGRFGPLALASVQPESEQLFSIRVSEEAGMHSETSLNLSVVADLATSLSHVPEFQACLPARINYTYYLDGEDIVFLRPKLEDDQPVYTSMNSVRRGKYLPIMRQVVEFLEAHKTDTVTLSDLIGFLAGGAGVGSPAFQKAVTFVHRLVDAGLILTAFQLPSNTRDRLSHLCRQVESLGVPRAVEIAALLRRLQENCQRFAPASVTERIQIQEETQHIVNDLLQWWRPAAASRAERTDYFMEDATFAGVQMQLGKPFFAPLTADLGPFLECVHARDQGGLSQTMLRDIFVDNFGVGGRCQNLMMFSLDHMRVMMNTLADRELDNKELFPRSAACNERALAYMKALGNNETPTKKREVHVSHEALQALTETFGGQLSAPLSSALNLQIAAESWQAYEQGDYLVAFNYALPGFGHFFTRYCYLFDDNPDGPPLTENLKQGLLAWQEAMPGGHEMAEVLSVLDHNAQIHPQLTARQIVPPNEVSALPDEQQIPYRSLEIDHDPETDQLRLWYSHDGQTPEQIIPMYMGFFHMMALPSFHRLIVDISPTGYHMERLKPNEHREGLLPYQPGDPAHGQSLRHYPRLRIGRFVLQREMWAFSPEIVPQPENDEFMRFLNVYAWAQEHELPREVFLRVKRKRDFSKFDYSFRTAHKPMLVDFENFFTLETFFYMIEGNNVEAVHVEEMLPNPRQLPLHIDGQRYVVEFQIELNREALADG